MMRRVIIVSPEELTTLREQLAKRSSDPNSRHGEKSKQAIGAMIIESQARTVAALECAGIDTKDRSLGGQGYYVGVYPADKSYGETKDYLLQQGYHTGIIRKRTRNQTVTLSFQMDDRGTIRKVYLWNVQDRAIIERRLKLLEKCLERSTPVVDLAYTKLQ